MILTHSSIIPPGYASTTEVAQYVVGELGGKEKKATKSDVLGLKMFARYNKGNFHSWGYLGNDKPDHCAHIGLMAGIMKNQILPRWKTPPGRLAPTDKDGKGDKADSKASKGDKADSKASKSDKADSKASKGDSKASKKRKKADKSGS
jgi:hypothetical protein